MQPVFVRRGRLTTLLLAIGAALLLVPSAASAFTVELSTIVPPAAPAGIDSSFHARHRAAVHVAHQGLVGARRCHLEDRRVAGAAAARRGCHRGPAAPGAPAGNPAAPTSPAGGQGNGGEAAEPNSKSGSSQKTVPVEAPKAPVEAPKAPVEAPEAPPVEAPNETPVEAPVEAPTEAPAEAPNEVPVEAPAEAPNETPVEIPAEAPAESPAETPVETPAEAPAETPAEAPAEAPETGEGSGSGGGSESPSSSAPTWFAPSSVWNRRLAGNAPLAAKSAAYVAELQKQLTWADPWINTTEFSTPVYTVGANQATVRVHLVSTRGSYIDPALQAAFEAVPLPSNARPAAGTDKHLVVWQPSTDKMWEFWELQSQGPEWVAEWGGAMEHVSTSPGYFTTSSWAEAKTYWGATASSLPLLGGLMTVAELQKGEIPHALAMAIPEPARSYVWPAQRSDGYGEGADAIPEGTIFRLPASLDLASLDLPPTTLAIATAVQRYGMIVRDVSGCVCLYGEDPRSGAEPYPAIFGSKYPSELLNSFPWGQLQVVAPGT